MGVLTFLLGVSPKVYLAIIVIGVVVFGMGMLEKDGYNRGWASRNKDAVKEAAKLQIALEAEKARKQQVVEKVITVFRDRIKIVKETSDAIVNAVPPPIDNPILSGNYRVLHDAAASGVVPDPAKLDGDIKAAATVDAVTFRTAVAKNYGICHQIEVQLLSAQDLLRGLFNIKENENVGN